MDENQKKSILKSGAITLAIYFALFFIVVFVLILNMVAYLFLPIPFILHMYKHGLKSTIIVGIIALLITLILFPILALLTMLAVTVGAVMGYFYIERKGALAPIMAGMLTYLFNYLLIFAVSVYLFDFNLVNLIQSSVDNMIEMNQATGSFIQIPLDEHQISLYKESIELLTNAFPALMITSSFVMVGLHHMVNWRVLKRLGHEAEQLPPLREWTFPKSILWYYLVTLLFLILGFMEPGTALFPILFNLHYILEIVIYLQGLAVISYFSHHKNMGKILPTIAIIFTIFLPQIGMMIVRMIGIFEFGFGIRDRLNKNYEKKQKELE
jgi:uncharacterized protein YybS (DUF2232 family)